MNEDKRTLEEKLMNALDSLVWYNGLGEIVERWLTLEPEVGNTLIACPDNYKMTADEVDGAAWACEQLQVIWMIAVEIYGDYGTSPRFGWIEDKDGFRWFVKRILRTYQEAELEEEGAE